MYYVESCLQWYKPYNNNSLLNEKNIALVIGLYFTRSCFLFNKLDRQAKIRMLSLHSSVSPKLVKPIAWNRHV